MVNTREGGAMKPLVGFLVLPRHDAWGTPLRYERMEDGKAMRIISAGSDGRFEPDTWSSPEALVGYSQDAVIEGSRILTRIWQY
jgi:hypothetical protein